MATATAKHELDMTNGPMFRKLIVFAIPIILTNVLQILFNAADIAVLGIMPNGGENAVAAVGATTSLVSLVTSLFIGLSTGAQIVVSRKMGENDLEGARKAVGTSVWVSIVGGLLLVAVGVPFAKTFLTWMKCPSEIIEMATVYLMIYFAGMPIMMLYNFLASILRAVGDSMRPMIILAIGGVINVGLNVFFMAVVGWNVEGVALATVISQLVSAVCLLIMVIKSRGFSRLDAKFFKVYKRELKEIIKIGLPSGLQSSLYSISNVMIQSTVNTFGPLVVAGNSTGMQLEAFVYQVGHSVALACMSFVSQNFGMGKIKRIKKVVGESILLTFIFTFSIGMIFALLSGPLSSIIIDSPEAIAHAKERLWLLAPTYCLCGFMEVLAYSMRALGKSVTAMVVSLAGSVLLRIIWLKTVFFLNPTYEMVLYSYPITWVITVAMHLCFLIPTIKKIERKLKAEKESSNECQSA